jgi:hypothetical protein
MRLLALALALFGVLVASVAPAESFSVKPALRVLDKAPLVLKGTGFKRGEWVKVTVSTEPAELSQRRRASPSGSFVVQFDTFVDVCYGAKAATAVGARGSKASIVLERPWERYCLVPVVPVVPGGAP